MKSNIKILIPILGFAPQGGYRVLSELANAWIKMGHKCDFLVPSTSKDPYFPTLASIIYCNVGGVNSRQIVARNASGIDNFISLFAGLRKIGNEYDVIFANHSLTAWPVRFTNCGDALKFYYIQAYEPGYYPWFTDPAKRLLSKFSYNLKLNKIANSTTYKNDRLSSIPIIPPGIDLEIFTRKSARDISFHKSKILLGTIGRTEPYKGTAVAIAAYRAIRLKYPQLRMRVGFGNVPSAKDLDIITIRNNKLIKR